MSGKSKKSIKEQKLRTCRMVFDIKLPLGSIEDDLDAVMICIRDGLNKNCYNCDYQSQRIFFKEADLE